MDERQLRGVSAWLKEDLLLLSKVKVRLLNKSRNKVLNGQIGQINKKDREAIGERRYTGILLACVHVEDWVSFVHPPLPPFCSLIEGGRERVKCCSKALVPGNAATLRADLAW